jgi:SOS-response transcriptional repressor LexA
VLTEARALVLTAMRGYAKKHCRAPTLDELCDLTGTTSVGSMHKHVARLVEDGYATRDENGRAVAAKDCPCCGKPFNK